MGHQKSNIISYSTSALALFLFKTSVSGCGPSALVKSNCLYMYVKTRTLEPSGQWELSVSAKDETNKSGENVLLITYSVTEALRWSCPRLSVDITGVIFENKLTAWRRRNICLYAYAQKKVHVYRVKSVLNEF